MAGTTTWKWLKGIALGAVVASASVSLPGLVSAPARAATVLKLDVAQAARISRWVVRARVQALTTVDLRADGDSIYTDVTLAVAAVYRGDGAPATVVMRLQGGVAPDGLAVSVPGMPRFTVGDDVVVFLEEVGNGLVPAGLEQGVWRIAPGPFGHPIVYRKLEQLALMERTSDGKLVPSAPAGPLPGKLLADLVREIRAVVP